MAGNSAAITGLWEGHCLRRRVGNSTARDVAGDAADITLSGVSATTEADGVTVEDGTVTITAAGVYRLTGSLTGGVVVAAGEDDQVVLILDGATITNDAGPAISVTSADAAAIKTAKMAISRAVPVVGGILADAADSVLAGAGAVKNTVGAAGLLAVLAVCLLPLMRLGSGE